MLTENVLCAGAVHPVHLVRHFLQEVVEAVRMLLIFLRAVFWRNPQSIYPGY